MATGTEVGSVYLRLALESDVNQQVQQATDEVGKTASTSFGNMFKKAFSVAAVAAAINAFKSFANEAISLYRIQEDAEVRLETVMRQRMGATDTQIQQIKDMASAIQEVGVVGDEVTLSGAQQLATFLSSTESLKTLMPAMDDLLVAQKTLNATAGDAVNIGNMFGKVMQGQTAALSRVGITFDETQAEMLKFGTEEERAATLAEIITNNVGEMNKALAATDSGKIQSVEMALGDVKEEFGEAFQELKVSFLPAMTEFIKLLADLAAKLQSIAGIVTEFSSAVGLTKNPFQDSIRGDAKEQYDALIAQRQDIMSQIQALTADDVEEVAEEVAEAVSDTKSDNSNPSASFDQFNILRFKDATKNLLDASETLEGAADSMGIDLSDTPDKDQIEDLQKLLEDINNQILQMYHDNTYSEETVNAINEHMEEIKDENIADRINDWADSKTQGDTLVWNKDLLYWIENIASDAQKEIWNRYYDPSTQMLNTEDMTYAERRTLEDAINAVFPNGTEDQTSLRDVAEAFFGDGGSFTKGVEAWGDMWSGYFQNAEDNLSEMKAYDSDVYKLTDEELQEIREVDSKLAQIVDKYMNPSDNTLSGKASGMSEQEFAYFYNFHKNKTNDNMFSHDSSESYFKVKVPGYASGGVAYQPELAIVGDHKSGGGEIIAPENLMRQIIKEELGRNNQTINLTAPIYIDGDYITDANIRNINTQTQLRGKQQIR